MTASKREIDDVTGVETTGHEHVAALHAALPVSA